MAQISFWLDQAGTGNEFGGKGICSDNQAQVLIGYAAYCLRRIGSSKGKEQANTLYQKLAEKGERVSLEERFAKNELKEYLDRLR